jgi:deoxyribodipyrimidine photo-lyase
MIAARRPAWNHALDRALELALLWQRPLVVLEPLRADYPWASDRHHAFIIDGMRANAAAFASTPVAYYPYLEESPDAGTGLLAALSRHACAVVTDDYPAFFYPAMLGAAGRQVPVRVEAVDGNGLLPMRSAGRLFTSAYHFRRHVQRVLPEWLDDMPEPEPLGWIRLPTPPVLPEEILTRWPPADLSRATDDLVAACPVDRSVPATTSVGGWQAGTDILDRFLAERLHRYGSDRNEPGPPAATSGLSPWLHFGHVGAHQIVSRVLDEAGWRAPSAAIKATGAREGWWGLDASAEAFLDQIITWRELGFNECALRPDFDAFETLPAWAVATLTEHEADPRPHQYTLAALEAAATHDPLWNAAQTQLVRDGVVHNYLRMLWGKKILEWSASPREALEVMVGLNNKYALDGRDPNSYNGIMWVLGRFDRGWPERAVYGKVRSMSSKNTVRKIDAAGYLETYGGGLPGPSQAALGLA